MYSPTDHKFKMARSLWLPLIAVSILAIIAVIVLSGRGRTSSSPPTDSPDSLIKHLPAGPRPVKSWPVILSNSISFRPAVADIDGDGRDELAVGVKDCRVYLLDENGRTLPGWPCETVASISRGPMMEDIDGDGEHEIVAGSNDGFIHMWREDGSIVKGWPVDLGSKSASAPIPVRSSELKPASILFCTEPGVVHLLSPAGKSREGWPKRLPQVIRAGNYDRRPAWAADLDMDGSSEIICMTTSPVVIYAWYADGEDFPGFPVRMRDGPGLGMAIDDVTDPGSIAVTSAKKVILLDLKAGSEISWPLEREESNLVTGPYFISSGKTEDAKAELVLAGTVDGYVYMWDLKGGLAAGWPIHVDGFIYGLREDEEKHFVYGPPVLADVDGDGVDEIILGSYDHHLYCFELDGTPVPGWPVVLDDFIINALTLAQLDGEGEKELVVGQAGETLFAWHLGPDRPSDASLSHRKIRTYSDWPLIYYAVTLAILLMLFLLMHLLRMELTDRSDSTGGRLRGALFFIGLFLLVRALFFAGDLYRYSTTIDLLAKAETDVRISLETERVKAKKLTDELAVNLRACRFEHLKDPHRALRCLERLADHNRLEYRFSGVLLADPSGRVIRGVGLGKGWSHLSEMGLEEGGSEEPVLLGGIPVFATECDLSLAAGQDTLRFFLLTSLLNKIPNALADATGFSAHIRVDGMTMAWGGAGPRPYRSLRPWLGIVQPAREISIGRSPKHNEVTVLLAKEDFERPYSQWLDLIAVMIIPCIYLFMVRRWGDKVKVRLKPWWIVGFAALYVTAAVLLHQGRLDTGPVPVAGRALEVLLHMVGITGVVVALDRIVTSRRSQRLNFALLGSYLFVSLIPLAVIMIVSGNIFLGIQRGVVEKTIEGLEKRADNMVLAYMGNMGFANQLLRKGPALFELSTETSWLNFIAENQYLFTYDLPEAYMTLWAREREDHSRIFTGYSYTAPRTGKLYNTRPGWTGDQNVRGLFLDNGTAVIRAMRMYRYREFEMDLTSHIPIDDRIINEMEDRLRVVPFMPRFHLEPAWLESTAERSRPEGWYIPYSSELVLQARGWYSGRPRWVIYRTNMYIPAGKEMLRVLVPVILLTLLPLGLSFWGAYTTFKRTARPLTRLLVGIRRVGQGDLEYRLGESGESEVGMAARSFDLMAASLEETIDQLAAKKKVEEVSELKSHFISMVSHDLKTPLSSIKGATENILEEVAGPVTDRQRRYLEMIIKSSGDLQRMITDLLDLSRIESGRLILDIGPLDIRREAEDLLRSIAPLLEREGMKGVLNVSAEETIVQGDRTRVWQILNNIVSNAIRHSPEGGTIEIMIDDIQVDDIQVDETDGRRMLQVSVCDAGPGIDEEDASKLFEPFFYRSSGRTGAHGAGLGLAIVKQLVELHGGTVLLRSASTGGAVFTFTLPV